MKRQNTIVIDGDELVLSSGFPHFSSYETRRLPINQLLSIQVKGDDVLGYYIQLNDQITREKYKEVEELPAGRRGQARHKIRPLRYGLWYDMSEAKEMAEKLSKVLDIPLVNK